VKEIRQAQLHSAFWWNINYGPFGKGRGAWWDEKRSMIVEFFSRNPDGTSALFRSYAHRIAADFKWQSPLASLHPAVCVSREKSWQLLLGWWIFERSCP
jgi:hypothetical protein